MRFPTDAAWKSQSSKPGADAPRAHRNHERAHWIDQDLPCATSVVRLDASSFGYSRAITSGLGEKDFRDRHPCGKINPRSAENAELAENATGPEKGPLQGTISRCRCRRQALHHPIVFFRSSSTAVGAFCPNGSMKVAKGHTAHEKHALPPSRDHKVLIAVNKIMT